MKKARLTRSQVLAEERRFIVKFLLAGLAVWLVAVGAGYAPPAWSQTSHQDSLRSGCDAAAKSKKLVGAAQKSFIDNCLSGKEAAAPVLSPQQKFQSCALKATDQKLSGDARKEFITNCLKD
jgi:hypothetical protein